MRQRQTSIADSLSLAGALLDQRYRLESAVHRTPTATIHLATHRNGSTAWLKLPFAKKDSEAVAREASIANTLGSPLLVRDDGATPDGLPYLVLEPPEGESLASLRARAAAGQRLPLARVMTLGDALARVVASVHALGYVTAGLEDADIFVFVNGEIALLDLHALAPTTRDGVAADVQQVTRVMKALLADVATAEQGKGRDAIAQALSTTHSDVAALQLAWRNASPEPVVTPVRIRPGSFADVPASMRLGGALPSEAHVARAQHATPLAMAIATQASEAEQLRSVQDGSMIDYLRTPAVLSVPPASLRDEVVQYDPIAKMRELPRLVQATSRTSEAEVKPGRAGFVIGASLAGLAAALMIAAGVFVLERSPSASALEVKPVARTTSATVRPRNDVPPSSPASPASPAPEPAAAPSSPAEDDLQLTTTLRSEGAPPDRDVFVDGVAIGKTPLNVTVPCGQHALQMVAGATKQAVELPCGGVSVVRYDATGHWVLRSK